MATNIKEKSLEEEYYTGEPFDCREELFMHDWGDFFWLEDNPYINTDRLQFCRKCGILRVKI